MTRRPIAFRVDPLRPPAEVPEGRRADYCRLARSLVRRGYTDPAQVRRRAMERLRAMHSPPEPREGLFG